jgi:hypothetical protein
MCAPQLPAHVSSAHWIVKQGEAPLCIMAFQKFCLREGLTSSFAMLWDRNAVHSCMSQCICKHDLQSLWIRSIRDATHMCNVLITCVSIPLARQRTTALVESNCKIFSNKKEEKSAQGCCNANAKIETARPNCHCQILIVHCFLVQFKIRASGSTLCYYVAHVYCCCWWPGLRQSWYWCINWYCIRMMHHADMIRQFHKYQIPWYLVNSVSIDVVRQSTLFVYQNEHRTILKTQLELLSLFQGSFIIFEGFLQEDKVNPEVTCKVFKNSL